MMYMGILPMCDLRLQTVFRYSETSCLIPRQFKDNKKETLRLRKQRHESEMLLTTLHVSSFGRALEYHPIKTPLYVLADENQLFFAGKHP